MKMSNLNLNEFFSSKFFHDQRWTIAVPSLARDGRHGIAMTTDGPPGNAVTIGELHWSLSTGQLNCLAHFWPISTCFVKKIFQPINISFEIFPVRKIVPQKRNFSRFSDCSEKSK